MLETNDKHASAEAYGGALQDIIQQILDDFWLKNDHFLCSFFTKENLISADTIFR